jgi:hypothetical protein
MGPSPGDIWSIVTMYLMFTCLYHFVGKSDWHASVHICHDSKDLILHRTWANQISKVTSVSHLMPGSLCRFLLLTHSVGMSCGTRQASTMVKLGDSSEVGAHNVIKTRHLLEDLCLDTFAISRSEQTVQKVLFPNPLLYCETSAPKAKGLTVPTWHPWSG